MCKKKIDLITIIISSNRGKTSIPASNKTQFSEVKKIICELEGWRESKIRCLLDGEHLQDDLTCHENGIQDQDEIDLFHEMIGGSGRDKQEENIRRMLDACESSEDSEDSGETESQDNFEKQTKSTCAENCLEELMVDKETAETDNSTEKEIVTKEKESEVIEDLNELRNKKILENEGESSEKKVSGLEEDSTHAIRRWYENLKLQYKEGKLKLCRSNPMDTKLIFPLQAKNLQPSELVRFRNIFSLWEQHKTWGSNESTEKTPDQNPRKRQLSLESQESDESSDETTPFKRRKILHKFGLSSPSPLTKKAHITEKEMKSLSVAVHLWADKEKGDIKYLQSTRLVNKHFEDLLKFAGPGSKWNLIKKRTIPQIRSLWRNTLSGIHYYRGHQKTGFENESQKHEPIAPFCPFGHCKSGLMSQIDVDLVLLTPKSKPKVDNQNQKSLLSRNLFGEIFTERSSSSEENSKSIKHKPEVFAGEVNNRTTGVVCESDVGTFEETPLKYQNAEYVDINQNQKQETEGGNETTECETAKRRH